MKEKDNILEITDYDITSLDSEMFTYEENDEEKRMLRICKELGVEVVDKTEHPDFFKEERSLKLSELYQEPIVANVTSNSAYPTLNVPFINFSNNDIEG